MIGLGMVRIVCNVWKKKEKLIPTHIFASSKVSVCLSVFYAIRIIYGYYGVELSWSSYFFVEGSLPFCNNDAMMGWKKNKEKS